jgi:transcriptional regulator with XRE-family HTH domain
VPLEKPNVEDPLSEPTRHRRLWAAYLAAGFTRREFAAKLGTNYHTVNRWDAGAAAISLDMLERASALVRYSMDDLCFGRAAAPAKPATPAPQRRESVLTEAEIRALFDTQRVDPSTRAAFGEHAASPAGRYQSFTPAYVEAWCAAYAYARDEAQALQAAVNARAVSEAAAAGVGAVSPEQLRAAFPGASKNRRDNS